MLRIKFVKLTLFLITLFFFTSCAVGVRKPPPPPSDTSGYTSSNASESLKVDNEIEQIDEKKVSGYTSHYASATSNLFVLKEVTSEFSEGDIVTFGDSKKEYEIRERPLILTMVKALKKSEPGNFQEIVLYKGVGFVIYPGIKVSVVR